MKSRHKRFVVASVSGWPILVSGATSGKARTCWAVHDSAVCYHRLTEDTVFFFGERGERRAREIAERLNTEDEAAR